MIFSTFLGGEGFDQISDMVVDREGTSHFVGSTDSRTFPTRNAFQQSAPIPGSTDSRLDAVFGSFASNGELTRASYLGGSGNDIGHAAGLFRGDLVIAGSTDSPDFPLKEPLQEEIGGGIDAFVTRVGASEPTVEFSTFIGGRRDDHAYGIDASRWVIALSGSTESTDFPTRHAFQSRNKGAFDAFIVTLDSRNAVGMSTLMGGARNEAALGIATRRKNLYAVGPTASSNFPFTTQPIKDKRSRAFFALFGI